MSISTQITVAATAETIIITAPGALRGPMGDVTPEVEALVERAELGASQSETSAGQASSSAAQAGDSAAEAASSAGSASGSAIAAAEDAADAGESKLSAEQSAVDAAASASAAGRFIMVSATAPTQRTNNTPLQIADEWQDDVNNLRMSWTGSAWVALNSSAQQLEERLKNNSDPTKGVAETGFAGSTSAIEFYRGRSLQAPSKISLSAHRGLSRVAPENTIAAFEMAARSGFQGLETDAQLTSDGVWVVIHDSQVNRTTNGTGNVKDMTLAQLRALDAGSWFDPYYSSEKIPTLGEYLRVCRVYGCVPNIELKDIERTYTDDEISSLATECKAAFPELDFVIYCFSNTLIARLRALHKDISLSYLTESYTTEAIELCAALHPCGLSINRTGVPADISYATNKGVYISSWTIDYSLFAEPLFKKGVRNLITNGWKP